MKRGSIKLLPDLLQEVYRGKYDKFHQYLLDNNKTDLDLHNQNLATEQIVHILQAIQGTNVTALNLAGNKITDETAKCFAKLRNTSLTELNLAENRLGDIGIEAIAKALPNTLTNLNVRGNLFGDIGAESLAKGIRRILLTHLDLSENMYIGIKGINAIMRGLPDTVTHLKLCNMRLKDLGAQAVAKVLRNKSSLTYLNLSRNEIGDLGAIAIANALPNNVATIRFYENRIGDKGAQAIAQALLRSELNMSITLDLDLNYIGNKGAEAIAKAFLIKNMTKISLAYNSISDEGAKAIAKVIPIAVQPAFFNLSRNDFMNKGLIDITRSSGGNRHAAASKKTSFFNL